MLQQKVSETMTLAYFAEKSKIMQPSTMLKTTLKVKKGIDRSNYNRQSAFLRETTCRLQK